MSTTSSIGPKALYHDRPQLIERWSAIAVGESWRLATNPDRLPELCQRVDVLLGRLADALADGTPWSAADEGMCEVVKQISFLGGWMAGEDLGAGALLAAVDALEAVLEPSDPSFFRQIRAAACEAYCAALEQGYRGQHRDVVEKAQVVTLIRSVPCLLLVADPHRRALDDGIGRVMMLAAMRAAPYIVVDFSALLDAQQVLEEALLLLRDHRRVGPPATICCGLPSGLVVKLEHYSRPDDLTVVASLDDALMAVC